MAGAPRCSATYGFVHWFDWWIWARGDTLYPAADISGSDVGMNHVGHQIVPVEATGAPAQSDVVGEGIPLVASRSGVSDQLPQPVPEDIEKKHYVVTYLPPEPWCTICAQAWLAGEPHHRRGPHRLRGHDDGLVQMTRRLRCSEVVCAAC